MNSQAWEEVENDLLQLPLQPAQLLLPGGQPGVVVAGQQVCSANAAAAARGLRAGSSLWLVQQLCPPVPGVQVLAATAPAVLALQVRLPLLLRHCCTVDVLAWPWWLHGTAAQLRLARRLLRQAGLWQGPWPQPMPCPTVPVPLGPHTARALPCQPATLAATAQQLLHQLWLEGLEPAQVTLRTGLAQPPQVAYEGLGCLPGQPLPLLLRQAQGLWEELQEHCPMPHTAHMLLCASQLRPSQARQLPPLALLPRHLRQHQRPLLGLAAALPPGTARSNMKEGM